MKVLQLLGPSTGGIRRHVATLADLLGRGGWTVTVAGPPGVMDGLAVGDAPVERLDVPSVTSPLAVLAARRRLRELLGEHRPDLVHAHGLKAGWLAVLARPGVPVVLTVHNVVLDEVAGRGAALQRRLERSLMRRVDRVIAVSPEIARSVAASAGRDRVEVVLPASPPPAPRGDRRQVRARLGAADPDAVLVVVVARLHPQKDLPTFVRAWELVHADHPAARAAIVGDGPSRDELAASIARSGVGGTLRLAGASDYAVDELAAADVVALSSRWEGAPLVVAEAMQLGKPVVSTRVGVVEEMVGDGGAIVEVGDAPGLAAALGRFVGSADLRAQTGTISHRRGTVIYGAEPLVDEVARVYQEVCDR